MDSSKSKIEHLIIHEVGNKLRDEKVFLSEELQVFDKKSCDIHILNGFVKPFISWLYRD